MEGCSGKGIRREHLLLLPPLLMLLLLPLLKLLIEELILLGVGKGGNQTKQEKSGGWLSACGGQTAGRVRWHPNPSSNKRGANRISSACAGTHERGEWDICSLMRKKRLQAWATVNKQYTEAHKPLLLAYHHTHIHIHIRQGLVRIPERLVHCVIQG